MAKKLARARQLKEEFDQAHKKGMKALADHDYQAMEDAVLQERSILQEHGAIIKQQAARIAKTKKAAKRR